MAGNGGPPQQTQPHHHQQQQHHLQQPHRPPGGMSDPQQSQQQKVKSPPGNGPPMDQSAMPPHHHPYNEPPGGHGMPPGQAPPPGAPPPPPPDGLMGGKEEAAAAAAAAAGLYPGHPGQYQQQQRYHDPNVIPQSDPYSHYRVVGGGKPTMVPPSRPPQRYMPSPGAPGTPPGAQVGPGQPPQGPTPTLNSLLQSHPPPQHRGGYPNSYDHQPPQQQHPPPPPPQSPYGPHQGQGWAPPPRPYSPQMGGPAQPYRPPPPTNASRGQSPYPPPGQSPGPYPPPPPPPQQQAPQQQPQQQQPPPQGGPPQPQPPPPGPGGVVVAGGAGGSVTSASAGGPQYSPYPQRYPTPPGNHRSPYPPPHQYPEPTRAWPGPGGPSPAASPGPQGGHPHPPPSPQQLHPPQSPGHAPSPSPQPPQPAQSPHQYPNRPSQASTPNANDADTGDSTGQNSNDSSSGVGAAVIATPGTPNSQAMRPTPSPTGSSGSRSMSPAVGQQNVQMPPRPSSSHSQVPNQAPQSTQNSNSQQHQQQSQPPPLDPATSPVRPPTAPGTNPQQQQSPAMAAAQGSYQTPPPPPPHMHGGYKMGPSPGPGPGPGPQNMSPYPPQSQQYSPGNYSPRPQYPGSYGPGPGGQPPPSNSMPPGPGQYPGRPMPNHVGPHSQFPPYQQNWGPPAPQPGGGMMGNHVQQQQPQQQQPGGKNAPPPPPGPPTGGSPRPLNYLKQHLQHKGGYVGAQSPTPPQGYGNGPGMHPPMGPPHHMGPPMGPTGSMGPPSSAPQNPPSGTPTVTSGAPGGPNSHPDGSVTPEGPQDNGISSSGPGASHPVTSLVTTGPDGAPLDEASQQSTLSNASAASADDPQCSTPKSRKGDQYNQSHLAPPSASPGAHQQHEDFEMGSPTWSRTPASPVFNSHVPQETYRSTKKSDSLCKLYDMDDNPDRRVWLDKLLSFMEDRRSPITACPTISKQPLDLYRLYMLVKERGGFVEVTKSKTWKDIAGMLGIGASSSAAYTLRKHYTKNLLTFECHFDRGGIDPLPIIQQVEAGSKKKNAKNTSVPSPVSVAGSSNSQDSFPPPGSSGASMDGYGGYPSGYPQGSTPDYNTPPMQRPPSQNNAQTPHPGNAPPASGDNISVSNPFDDPVGPSRAPYQQGAPYPPVSRPQGAPYQGGQPGYSQYGGPEQYGPPGPPGQYPPPAQGQFPPPNRTMYGPPYGPEGDASAPPTSNAPPTSADPYRGYGGAPSPYPPPPRPYTQQPPVSASQTLAPTGGPPQPGTPGAPGPYPPPPQQDYYRQPDQMSQNPNNSINMSSQLARQLVAPMSPAKSSLYHQNAPQPRRHPDFEKQPQPYSPYPQRPPMYGGWQNSTGQYRGQYPPQPAPQQWSSGQRPPGPPTGPGQGPPGQAWDRYPPQGQQPPYPGSQQGQPHWPGMGPGQPNVGPNAQLRPPQQRGKPISMPPPQGAKPVPGQFPQTGAPPKRDIVFPLDSVEATTPILYRRKRICKQDVGQVDPWRIFMSLRSGLLGESTWALDVINILLFDDTSVQYFGLAHLPGLLNLLLDHFQKSLADMFDPDTMEDRDGYEWVSSAQVKMNGECGDEVAGKETKDRGSIDLGGVCEAPNAEDRVLVLSSTTNYTMNSRKGIPVKINQSEDDIFVLDMKRSWDLDADKKGQMHSTVGGDPWSFGQSEPHPHGYIMNCFRAEIVNIPFARYLKGKEMSSSTDKQHRKHYNSSLIGASRNCGGSSVSKRNSNSGPSRTKRFKEEAPEEPVVAGKSATVKREPMDSDCRPVDMELEPRIPNGPESVTEDGKVSSDETSSSDKKADIVKKESEESAVGEEKTDQQFELKQTVRDPASTLKRRRMSDYEDECYTRDEASLYLVAESQDSLARRCVGISNILRNLTFVPGNEIEFAKSPTFLAILGKLLLLNHEHPIRTQKTRNYDREEDADFADSCSSLAGETEWWWDYLVQIRENMLVAAANISGHMELSRYDEMITRPVLDGLLHWAICPSAHGQDPFPTCGPHSSLSPQRLALEALCKLCVTDANVDLVIATPPFSRLEKLCAVLTRHLCRNEDQVLREFSVNLLHYLAAADSSMARTVAMQSPCISYLVAFIEQAEQTALGVANQHGISFLRENPDSMGTSLDMLRRAAGTLLHLARHPDNRPLFMQQEQRLLGLVMSHILDQQVALIISRVLFQVSRGQGPITTTGSELKRSEGVPTVAQASILTTSAASQPTTIVASSS